ncbi:MAG: DUF6116 family protein [Planctomycetota bacterium]|jgi:hypothetical protein
MPGPVNSLVQRYAGRLRYPRLLLLMLTLFGTDLVFPDAIPFVDEILLGLGTVLLGSLRKRRSEKLPQSEPGN